MPTPDCSQCPLAPQQAQRRQFLGGFVASLLALAAWPRHALAGKVSQLKLDKFPQLQKVGGAATIAIAGKPVVVIRTSSSTVVALAGTCTHKAGKLVYDDAKHGLFCSTHKSMYGLDGTPKSGQAASTKSKALQVYAARLTADSVMIQQA